MQPSAEEVEEERPAAEEGPLTEQQLGLRQVEERLHRDHIHRLVKVRPRSVFICALVRVDDKATVSTLSLSLKIDQNIQ